MAPYSSIFDAANRHMHVRYAKEVLLLGVMLMTISAMSGCSGDITPVPAPTRVPARTPTIIPTRPPTATPVPSPTATPYPLLDATVGETVEAGRLILTVTSVISPTVDARSGPAAGNRFIVLDLTIQNTGETPVPITVARELVLKDSTDQIYKVSARAIAAAGGTAPDMSLAPGERIVAQAGFEVPVTATGLVFTFAADRFGTGKVFVTLPEGQN